jgi:amino acid adenylation domain-containing protein/thioester reductase-like protein
MYNTQPYALIHQMFERQSLQTPNAIAITFKDQQLTYQELNQKANQVGHYLQSLGVKPETLVGVCIERSIEMLVVLLGVLKAGGAYVPLDPSYPADRIALMIEDSGIKITLTKQAQLDNLPQNLDRVIVLENEWEIIYQHSSDNLVSEVTMDNVAYTIYTSGSTGKPKGVQVLHGTVVNLLESMLLEPGLTAKDTILAVITISFDMSIPELFLPLSVGARIVMASDQEISDGVLLAQAILTSGATVMQATPATWRLLLATGWAGSQQLKIICGGEAMTRNLADLLLERCASLWNMYGPTETTVYSAIYQVQPGNEAIPIGRPVANTQIYMIAGPCRRKDDPLIQTIPGQPGEVYIGGDGLARGYLNQPEMTSAKFVPDPFSSTPGARLYRTGDLARMLPDGNIQYMGRVDHQVKIRGYRIELGDIEAALIQYPDVREVAVIVREDSTGDKRLVAYIVSKTHTDLGVQLRGYLKEKLPEYMVPANFVMMDAMPLTPNGKIDRRVLPAPSQARPSLEQIFVAPRNATEQKLAAIWSQILDIQLIGIHDNFFDLGGHSLLVAKMMIQLEEAFGLKLSLDSLFELPTIAGLTRSIDIETAKFAKLCESANFLPLDIAGLNQLAANTENAETSSIIDRQQHDSLTKINSFNLHSDALLDPSIFPEPGSVAAPSEPENILLTGVTGFLGAFLLDELLKSTKANIYCQIRCPNLTVGKQKLQKNLARYSLIDAAQSDRVIVIKGDLSQPLFGMSNAEFRQLANQIDLIYHNGAFVHLIYPYATLRDPNVLGTQEILRLASQVKVKPVHFISTLDVFQSTYHAQLEILSEQDDFPLSYQPESGYAQSKWVAEKLVKTAHERGIPTCIYRPGMIVGHSETGMSNTEDQIGRLIKGFIQLENAPDLSTPMHLTPVDYVSKAIVNLAHQQSSWGKAFHLTNPQALSLDQLLHQIQSRGYSVRSTAYQQWLKTLIEQQFDRDNALTSMIPLLTSQSEVYSNYLEVMNLARVDCQNTVAGLTGTTIVCPQLDSKLLDTYFSYFIQSGFLDHLNQAHSPEQLSLVTAS